MRSSVARRLARGARAGAATLLVALPVVLVALPGCGQKGPLMPASAKPAPAAAAASAPTR
jgi:predicted small lipoprotein YifL